MYIVDHTILLFITWLIQNEIKDMCACIAISTSSQTWCVYVAICIYKL